MKSIDRILDQNNLGEHLSIADDSRGQLFNPLVNGFDKGDFGQQFFPKSKKMTANNITDQKSDQNNQNESDYQLDANDRDVGLGLKFWREKPEEVVYHIDQGSDDQDRDYQRNDDNDSRDEIVFKDLRDFFY
jgi:hypothetical protein